MSLCPPERNGGRSACPHLLGMSVKAPRQATARTPPPLPKPPLSGFDERPRRWDRRKGPSLEQQRPRNLGESRVGLWGFPDAPSHATPGGSQRTTLSALSTNMPAYRPLPPPVVTRRPPFLGLHRWPGQWEQGPPRSGSEAGSPGLWAGARVTLRRASERWRGGPGGWRSEQRQVSLGQDAEQGSEDPDGNVPQSWSSTPRPPSATSVQGAPLGAGEGVRGLRLRGGVSGAAGRGLCAPDVGVGGGVGGWAEPGARGAGPGSGFRSRGDRGVLQGARWGRRGAAPRWRRRAGTWRAGAPGSRRARPGAGAAAQWQEAEPRALSRGRRRPPLPPAAMGTGPGVSGRRAASRPGPGLPCRAGGRARDGEGQVRGAGGGGPGGRASAGPAVCFPTPRPRGPGGGGGPPALSLLCLGLPPDTPVGPRPCAGAPSLFPSSVRALPTTRCSGLWPQP